MTTTIPTRDDVLAGRVPRPFFVDKGAVHSIRGEKTIRYHVDVYQQPPLDRARAWLYHHVWEKATWRLLRKVQPYFTARHDRKCGDSCGYDYDFHGDGSLDQIPLCAYVPLTNRQDIRCFNLHEKNRRALAVYEVTKDQYDMVKV